MATPQEPDFPPGHPGRFDYDPASPEAKAWAAAHYSLKGERDYPLGHPKACDTPGNTNHVAIRAGVDPLHPELQEFSGRTPAQVAGLRAYEQAAQAVAVESPAREPITAPAPPQGGEQAQPSGQPSAS
jgi:hypothetical protein